MRHFTCIVIFISLFRYAGAQSANEWRPENRTGVSSEKGLLKTWPVEGPSLIWMNSELGKGYSSPSFGQKTIYITGLKGNQELLYALDMAGKLLWQTSVGRAWTGSSRESRATPTVEGNRVYTCSGDGDLACVDGTNGKVIWTYKASEIHKGTFGSWGIAESLLVDGDKVFFSPGGPETMTIAINKNNGQLVWKSKSLNDKPGYVSPMVVTYAGYRMIINASLGHLFAVNAANGDILWKVAHEPSSDNDDLIKCVTPLFNAGMVYVTGGYDTGGMMVKMGEDGKSANIVWTDKVLDVHHGGVVMIDGYIYGSNWLNNSDGDWCCIEWKTGKKMWEQHWNCKGSVIAAEGKLYIYDEKKGNVGLLNVNPQKFDLVSTFRVSGGNSGPYWAHPVIHNGVLYLRHTNALMAYDIKQK